MTNQSWYYLEEENTSEREKIGEIEISEENQTKEREKTK